MSLSTQILRFILQSGTTFKIVCTPEQKSLIHKGIKCITSCGLVIDHDLLEECDVNDMHCLIADLMYIGETGKIPVYCWSIRYGLIRPSNVI